jgi:trehalose/maltose transport system permease protein
MNGTPRAIFWNVMFYAAVVLIVVVAVFPFYYAVLTSFESGTAIFEVNYLPASLDLSNYVTVLSGRNFIRSVANSVFIATVTVVAALFLAVTASYALARVRFRGRGLLLMTILAVSMFPQIAVLAGLYEDVTGAAQVVLTRRSKALRSHSGEVSFPGGRQEPGEEDFVLKPIG